MPKRNFMLFLLGLFACLGLTACGPMPPQYQTTYSYIPPQSNSGRMCLMQCNQMKMMCQQSASMQNMQNNMQNAQCEQIAETNAQLAYEAYKEKRQSEGRKIKKSVNDFLDTSSCNNNYFNNNNAGGDCEGNFRDCFVSCGGQVVPHTQCVAFCNPPPQVVH